MLNIYSLTLNEFIKECETLNIIKHHAVNAYKSFYRPFQQKPLKFDDIISNFNFDLPQIAKVLSANDGTYKFLIEFQDGLKVEAVLIPFHKRYSICLSTQVGCAMNCSFCYTGKQGFKRNLLSHEIVGQYLVVRNFLLSKKPNALNPSIVFMGQGEPLHNVFEVKKATSIFLESFGLHLGPKQITLSTVGYLPQIKELKNFPPINIALSLHSPFNEVRNQLIPINEKYPLEKVLNELETIPLSKKQFINCEYLLIKNINDSTQDALALVDLLKNKKVIVNLIPYNPIPNVDYQKPSTEQIEHFKRILVDHQIHVMIRTTKGDEIMAACGQLNSKFIQDQQSQISP